MEEERNNIQNLPYWEYLTKEEKNIVASNVRIRLAAKGDILYGHGTTCMGMAHVIQGCLRVYIVSEEGREITLYRVEKGENCVLSASCVISQITFDTVIEAQSDTKLLVLNTGVFSELSQKNIYVKAFMYELATERFSQVMKVMQEVLFFRFDQRLAHFLLEVYEKTGKPEIRMTQDEIAGQVNSAREVVTRMLRSFSEDGLVEIGRGKILIKDPEALRLLG